MKQIDIFNQLYHQYYGMFTWRCTRAVKDEVVASGMVHDAFLKVWMLRDQLLIDDVYSFLKLQLKKAIFNYYDIAKNRFHANLFSLDEFENIDFLLKVSLEEEDDEVFEPNWDEVSESREQWEQLQEVIPSLPETQQQLIKLCLKYNFSYDRIAYYLGGISDYAVGKQVEALLKNLKHILSDTQQLLQVKQKSTITFSGFLDELQTSIIKMRYELQYSFEDMAKVLGISEVDVKIAYARAFRQINK